MNMPVFYIKIEGAFEEVLCRLEQRPSIEGLKVLVEGFRRIDYLDETIGTVPHGFEFLLRSGDFTQIEIARKPGGSDLELLIMVIESLLGLIVRTSEAQRIAF